MYLFLPRKGKNVLLLVASLLFYAWGEPKYIFLMLFSITLNYLGGFWVNAAGERTRKLALAVIVLANLALLGYFKYYSFAGDTLAALFGRQVLPVRDIALPLGISFYTFQAMSYVIDLYRGKTQLQKSWFLMALYISFFPQLVAGPIVRYTEIEAQLQNRCVTVQDFSYGVKRFLYGMAKKVILANCFAARADEVFGLVPSAVSTPLAWLGALYYTLQIYYDFSGYSDMAIGLGAMFGFTFPENFHYPYLSRSVSEFWRRWHMSLSGWFKEYLYIPKKYDLVKHHITQSGSEGDDCVTFDGVLSVNIDGDISQKTINGTGNGPIDAFFNAMKSIGVDCYKFLSYSEHAISEGSDSKAIAYIELLRKNGKGIFGVGIGSNINMASIYGLLNAINRANYLLKQGK